MNRILFFIFFGIIGLSACQKEKVIELKNIDAVIVANAQFTTDSLWKVSITNSEVISEDKKIQNLEDAEVNIYEGDKLLETLIYQAPSGQTSTPERTERGFFHSTVHRPEMGKSYTLEVAADGYEEVQATDAIPPMTGNIETFEFIGYDTEEGTGQLKFKFRDESPDQNYYQILLYSIKTPFEIMDGDTTFYPEQAVEIDRYSLFGENENDLITSDEEAFEISLGDDSGYYFSDQSFNNKDKELIMTFFAPQLNASAETSFGIGQKMFVELRAISENSFKYYRSLSLQAGKTNAFSEPVLIFNNVKNGLGNFSGFSRIFSEQIHIKG